MAWKVVTDWRVHWSLNALMKVEHTKWVTETAMTKDRQILRRGLSRGRSRISSILLMSVPHILMHHAHLFPRLCGLTYLSKPSNEKYCYWPQPGRACQQYAFLRFRGHSHFVSLADTFAWPCDRWSSGRRSSGVLLRWMAMFALFWAEGDSCPTPGPQTRRPRQAPLHSFEHCHTPPRSWLYYSLLFCLFISHQSCCLCTFLGLHGDRFASDKSCCAKSCKCDWATLAQALWCPMSQVLTLEAPADRTGACSARCDQHAHPGECGGCCHCCHAVHCALPRAQGHGLDHAAAGQQHSFSQCCPTRPDDAIFHYDLSSSRFWCPMCM